MMFRLILILINKIWCSYVFASGCKTARVVVHIFLMVVSLSGVSGGGVGVGGWGGCDNVNVDTFLILAFGIF